MERSISQFSDRTVVMEFNPKQGTRGGGKMIIITKDGQPAKTVQRIRQIRGYSIMKFIERKEELWASSLCMHTIQEGMQYTY